MKKFICVTFTFILAIFSIFSFSSCSTNEIEKVSKGLSSYEITASLDTENMQISGSEKVNYVNSTGISLNYLCFHLYPRSFREDALIKPYTTLTIATCFPNGISYGDIQISSVLVNGSEANFSIVGEDEDILQVDFNSAVEDGSSVEIVIEFLLTIPNCTHRLGFYDGSVNLGNWYPIACEFDGEDFDTTPYYSTGDPFYSGIANYSVTLSYPSEYQFFSTGEATTTEADGIKTSVATAKAVRDFAICLSTNAQVVSAEVDGITVSYVGDAGDENLSLMLEVSKNALEFFNETFGEYPYSTLTVVKTPFIYGGMEYPNIVFISDSIDEDEVLLKVIVHEIAHQWWYGVVGNNEICEAWLDESLAEYSTALFFEHNSQYDVSYEDIVSTALSSYLLYVDVISTIKGEVNTQMNLPVSEYQNDYEYSYMIYVKGVIMFDSLREMVGEDRLIAGLKKYYSENKFKIASKADFYDAFESACHTDLYGFFEGYLNGTTIITRIS